MRNSAATLPWQHVLEPLGGYLLLAEALRHWPGSWEDQSDPQAPHEASLLNLVIDKAHHQLGWSPRWNFATTVERTVGWYRQVQEGAGSALEWCQADLVLYQKIPTL